MEGEAREGKILNLLEKPVAALQTPLSSFNESIHTLSQ